MADAKPFHWEYEPPRVAHERYIVTGGTALEGTVTVSGAKNSALKLLAAARASLQQALLRIRVAERRHREGPRRHG